MAGATGINAGALAIEIEGKPAGLVNSVVGGSPVGDVVVAAQGSSSSVFPAKHIANARWTDIEITCGLPGGDLANWIAAFVSGAGTSQDGAIDMLDATGKSQRRLAWQNGVISSVTFPGLDASSKDVAELIVTITPEIVQLTTGSGAQVMAAPSKSSPWLAANFALTISGVDCSHVSSIAALTIAQPVIADQIGIFRESTQHVAPMSLDNLVATVPLSGAVDFETWATNFLVNGQNTSATLAQATLTYLAPDLKTALLTLTLSGVGISALADARRDHDADTVATTTATMYCTQSHLSYGAPAIASTPTVNPPVVAGPVVGPVISPVVPTSIRPVLAVNPPVLPPT